jgi:hypothetical protein
MNKTIVVVIAILVGSLCARGQDPSAQSTTPPASGSNADEESRKREIQTLSAQMRQLVARKAHLEKLLAELTNESRLLLIRQNPIRSRIREFENALATARASHGSRRAKNTVVTYDKREEMQKLQNTIAAEKAALAQAQDRLEKVGSSKAVAEDELTSLGFTLQEKRIALTSLGVDVAPLLVPPGPPKVERVTGPAPTKIFVTKDGSMYAAVSARLDGDVWMITTPAGKEIGVASEQVEKIIDKTKAKEQTTR